MDYIGIDLHRIFSQVRILTEDGKLIERLIKADRESFDKLFADRPPAGILVEDSTGSEWCAGRDVPPAPEGVRVAVQPPAR